MKKLLIILFAVIGSISCFAGNVYHVSNSGNDSRNGLTDSTAWASIGKVNTMFSTFVPGDSILFESGGTYYGSLIVTKSGNPANPIVIGSYGTGAKPVISGFTNATGWVAAGTNKWQSATVVGTNAPNMITVNSAVANVGRWPNSGYKKITSHVTNISITDPTLTGTPNWTGATICIRELHDIISTDKITNHTGQTISYSATSGYTPQDGYGYFIKNALLTIDTLDEWYFDPATRKTTIHSVSSPTGVRVATKDTLLYIGQYDYITVDGLAFEGGNVASICLGSTTNQAINTTIKNCDINFSGRDAIYGTNSTGSIITNCDINNSLNNAIMYESEGGRSLNSTITFNHLHNTGTKAGMGYINAPAGYNISYNGITVFGQNSLIQYNQIDTTGHVAIAFYYNDVKVRNNFINYHNYVTDDGGGINTFDITFGATVETGREILNNIILNGIGAPVGTLDNKKTVHAIYIDDKADGILIQGNTGANSGEAIMYVHNGTNLTIRDNTFYNGEYSQALFVHDNHALGMPIRNILFKNNILFSKTSTQLLLVTRTYRRDVDSIYNPSDSNVFARPILPAGTTFQTREGYSNTPAFLDSTKNYTFTTYKAKYATALHGPYELNSIQMGLNSNPDTLFYNASNAIVTLSFPGKSKIDPRGNVYNNSVLLPPSSSLILLNNGSTANLPPTSDAGGDQTITQPTSAASLSGTGTDPEGGALSYHWSWETGPGPSSVLSPNAQTTTVNGMVIPGDYKFKLKVSDLIGDSSISFVKVKVLAITPPVNQLPTSNAGTAMVLTLPANTADLDGTGSTDPDGTISNYGWTKFSGPATGTITGANTATPHLSNLVLGEYFYQLIVIDNAGGKDTGWVKVTVKAAIPINQNPVANAGADTVIVAPANTATLRGSGTDLDGTISTYHWVKTSGPATGSITDANAATTGLTNLVEGVYEFELTVSDNSGGTGKKKVYVTVQAAAGGPCTNCLLSNKILIKL